MTDGAEVKVDPASLRRVRKALRDVDVGLTRDLNRRLRDEVAAPVAAEAAARVPHKSGKWAASIRPGGNAKGAWVTWGRKDVPYAGWVEFGGNAGHYGHDGKRNGPRRLPVSRGGRYVHPVVEANRERAVHVAEQVVRDITKRAGLA